MYVHVQHGKHTCACTHTHSYYCNCCKLDDSTGRLVAVMSQHVDNSHIFHVISEFEHDYIFFSLPLLPAYSLHCCVSKGNMILDLESYCSATLVRNICASVLIIVLVNVNIWHLPGDIQSIYSTSQFMLCVIYDMHSTKLRTLSAFGWRFYHTKLWFSPLPALADVATDPRHTELTLLVVFMTCLRLVNMVANTPLGFRTKTSAPLQPLHTSF